MRRLAVGVAAAALALGAAALPRPAPPREPLAGTVIERPGIESPVDAAIWYCPWAQSSATRDSFLAVAALVPAEAEVTFPVAIPGELPDQASLATLGPGATGIVLSEVARRGDSPGFAEFTGGPSAVTVTVSGEVLTADACVSHGPEEWFFVGGSTRTGEGLLLRLFNPFPETAKVTVTGFSEIGVEVLGDLRSISINPRSWRDVSFAEQLRQRQALAISVRVDSGLVVPAMSFSSGGDEAWWGGTDLSTEWEFPVVRTDGLDESAIVVANPGLGDVEVGVDLYTEDGAQRDAFRFTIGPESPLRIGFGEVAADVVGARVSATSPVAASVVAIGEAGTAVTAGSPVRARAWLVPGLRSAGPGRGTLWLLNSSDEAVTVTVSALTGDDTINSKEVLGPGTQLGLPVTVTGSLGYLVSSTDPFSVSWSITGPSGTAYASALAVPDE